VSEATATDLRAGSPGSTPPGSGFSTFYAEDPGDRRRWGPAMLGSAGLYALLAVLALLLGKATKQVIEEKKIDLTFVQKVVKPEPPPPPPPKLVEAAPEPPKPIEKKPDVPRPVAAKPPAAAAVVRPDQKIRRLDKPPPVKKFVAPREMPLEAPKEADPSEDKGIAVYGEPGDGDPAGLEGGEADGLAGGDVGGGAGALPENASPPEPLRTNVVPVYPEDARTSGRTGVVVLKVVVLPDGSVGDVRAMRGEEPFVSAAIAAVKRWKYEPARVDGQPITVYRIVQIPFKLSA